MRCRVRIMAVCSTSRLPKRTISRCGDPTPDDDRSAAGGNPVSCLIVPEYVEEATYQFLLHVQNLMDRETGLWFYDWNYEGCHNFAHARWARGNGWLTIVIPDFLELVDLPTNNAVRRYPGAAY